MDLSTSQEDDLVSHSQGWGRGAYRDLEASGGMIHKSVEYFYYSYLHLVSTLASMYANGFYDMPDEREDAQS